MKNETKKIKLTNNQRYYLKHIARHGATSEHRIAHQLEKKGLIIINLHKYVRTEFGKVAARLTTAQLTDEGKRVLSHCEECTCES